MKMTIKTEWIRRLRGGYWKQANNALEENTRERCCLGVLCDIYAKEHRFRNWWKNVIYRKIIDSDMTNQMPSNAVLRWAGLTLKTALTLASMNDRGKSFNAIADHIETYKGT